MKKTLLLLLLPLLAITFNSCEKDDYGDEKGTTKLVKRIVEGNDVTTFEYDNQNRLIKTTWDGNSDGIYTTNIVYEDNKMILTGSSNVYPDKNIDTYYFEDGYLIKQDYGYRDYWDYYTYTYSDGYLSEIKKSEEDDRYTGSDFFTWHNGNLISERSGGGNSEYIYEYTDIPNKPNIQVGWGADFYIDRVLSGMKGLFCKNLLASQKRYDHNRLSATYTFTYTLDNDGYPIEMLVRGDDGYIGNTTITYN